MLFFAEHCLETVLHLQCIGGYLCSEEGISAGIESIICGEVIPSEEANSNILLDAGDAY